MFNAYPDSIGRRLADTVALLNRPELKDVFSLFYILPTFFNSDLDRGFSIVDYDINTELVSEEDLSELRRLGILLKLDLILNHLSVGSPQFKDLLRYGDESRYKDFFIDWNRFWQGHGEMSADGHLIPHPDFLQKLFMRKPGLPILKVRFPDGTHRPYWNTFYQEVNYRPVTAEDFMEIRDLPEGAPEELAKIANDAIAAKTDVNQIDLGRYSDYRSEVISVVEQKRQYLGQMDINAQSEDVWRFYDETLAKLAGYGAKIIRLDAFAYLHKEPGQANFFNRPGTWEYLARLRGLAERHELIIFPEVHAEYGTGIHEEVSGKGYPIYDFFFPGLVIDALDRGITRYLERWIRELLDQRIDTINMLGCHDGIPVLDLRGKEVGGIRRDGLMSDEEIDAIMDRIIARGGRVKNLYGPDGKKISYYQVNATFFSALGEDERKLLLARAIQMFMPGIPQVWYLDLFAGKNDYAAADRGGTAGHKEINRTNLSMRTVEDGLGRPIVRDQLLLMRLRNTCPAFNGALEIGGSAEQVLQLTWRNGSMSASLWADLRELAFSVVRDDGAGAQVILSYPTPSDASARTARP
jgi:sucrose phosphorylase